MPLRDLPQEVEAQWVAEEARDTARNVRDPMGKGSGSDLWGR